MSGWKIFWNSAKWDMLLLFICLWAANAGRGFFAGLATVGIIGLGLGLAMDWRSAWIRSEQEEHTSQD